MEIINDKKNSLLGRREINLNSDKNLSFEEAKKLISEQLKENEDIINVRNVKGTFGSKKFVISVDVYDSREELEAIKNGELSRKKRLEIEEIKKNAEEKATTEDS